MRKFLCILLVFLTGIPPITGPRGFLAPEPALNLPNASPQVDRIKESLGTLQSLISNMPSEPIDFDSMFPVFHRSDVQRQESTRRTHSTPREQTPVPVVISPPVKKEGSDAIPSIDFMEQWRLLVKDNPFLRRQTIDKIRIIWELWESQGFIYGRLKQKTTGGGNCGHIHINRKVPLAIFYVGRQDENGRPEIILIGLGDIRNRRDPYYCGWGDHSAFSPFIAKTVDRKYLVPEGLNEIMSVPIEPDRESSQIEPENGDSEVESEAVSIDLDFLAMAREMAPRITEEWEKIASDSDSEELVAVITDAILEELTVEIEVTEGVSTESLSAGVEQVVREVYEKRTDAAQAEPVHEQITPVTPMVVPAAGKLSPIEEKIQEALDVLKDWGLMNEEREAEFQERLTQMKAEISASAEPSDRPLRKVRGNLHGAIHETEKWITDVVTRSSLLEQNIKTSLEQVLSQEHLQERRIVEVSELEGRLVALRTVQIQKIPGTDLYDLDSIPQKDDFLKQTAETVHFLSDLTERINQLQTLKNRVERLQELAMSYRRTDIRPWSSYLQSAYQTAVKAISENSRQISIQEVIRILEEMIEGDEQIMERVIAQVTERVRESAQEAMLVAMERLDTAVQKMSESFREMMGELPENIASCAKFSHTDHRTNLVRMPVHGHALRDLTDEAIEAAHGRIGFYKVYEPYVSCLIRKETSIFTEKLTHWNEHAKILREALSRKEEDKEMLYDQLMVSGNEIAKCGVGFACAITYLLWNYVKKEGEGINELIETHTGIKLKSNLEIDFIDSEEAKREHDQVREFMCSVAIYRAWIELIEVWRKTYPKTDKTGLNNLLDQWLVDIQNGKRDIEIEWSGGGKAPTIRIKDLEIKKATLIETMLGVSNSPVIEHSL